MTKKIIHSVLLLSLGLSAAIAQDKGAQSGADFITRLDTDGDGQVSQSEFDGPDKHFTKFDADGDGYITESEAPTGPPPGGKGGKGSKGGKGGGQRSQ